MLAFYFGRQAEGSPANEYYEFEALEANGSQSICVSTFSGDGTQLFDLLKIYDCLTTVLDKMREILVRVAVIEVWYNCTSSSNSRS
jgi:hypothetical protein